MTEAETENPECWRETNAYTLGVQAYVFGFPYVNLAALRWKWVTQAPPPGDTTTPYAALNHFFHFRNLVDASYRDGGGPNNDTLYSLAWVDVSTEPVILSHPDMGERFFILQLACLDGDNFAAVGQRSTGPNAGHFAIVGPAWHGELPNGVQALPPSRSGSVFVLGRTLVDGPEDVAAVNHLQDQYAFVPLSLWGKTDPGALPVRHEAWQPFDPGSDPLAEWKTMNRAMAEGPPEPRLAALTDLFATIGVGPSLDVEAQDEETKRGLARAAVDGRQMLMAINRSGNSFMGAKANGWSIPPRNFGRLGLVDNFLLRAALCMAGFVQPWEEDAFVPVTTADCNDALLEGGARYTIRFAPGALPKVHGFWSITVYDSTDNLTPNPLNRYSIGNRTPGLKQDDDGGLTIYLQHESPGTDLESNWLPSPPPGPYRLAFRAYWPYPEIYDGSWQPPGVTPVP